MRRLILALSIALSLFVGGRAQEVTADKSGANKSAVGTAQQATAQSPELTEAGQLSVQSIKLYGNGNFDEAIALGKRSLQIREKALGPKHPLVALSLANLALIYTARNDLQEAINLYHRALEIYEKGLSPDPQKASQILTGLSLLYMSRGWLDKAEEFLERSLAHLEQALGKEHSSLIVPLFLLAELHQARTDYDKAEPFYRRALTIKEREAKPNSADAERIRARYACALWKSERYDEARALKPSELGGLLKGEKGIVGTPPPSSPISVLNSKALSLPKPTYPLEARKKYVSGEVLVGVVVNEEGNVIQACALWGDKLLAEVSENAARKARFTPTLVNGQPIKVSGTIKYNFVSPR